MRCKVSSPSSEPQSGITEPTATEPGGQGGLSRRKLFGAVGVTAAVAGAAATGALAGRSSAAVVVATSLALLALLGHCCRRSLKRLALSAWYSPLYFLVLSAFVFALTQLIPWILKHGN